MLPGVFVGVRAGGNNDQLSLRRQRHRADDFGSGGHGRIENFLAAFIDDPMIIGFQFNSNSAFWHIKTLCHAGTVSQFLLINTYLVTLMIAPAPTVKPPSRMANRSLSSRATG